MDIDPTIAMDVDPIIPNSDVFDFSRTPLADDYTGFYVKVLDNVFTPAECKNLISLAESDAGWEQAAIATSHGDVIDQNYRNSGRIIRFDHDTASQIYQRLLPFVQELVEIRAGQKWAGIVNNRPSAVWRMVGVNERLSFLRYQPGDFFKPHNDGQLRLRDGRHSKVTLQIYLNDEGLEGGATRIWGYDFERFIDIEPKMGRVLIFQQRGLRHSGQEITKGVKYAMRRDFMFVENKEH